MNIKLINLLGGVCAMLAILLLIEWMGAKYALSSLLGSGANPSNQSYQIENVPTIDLSGKTEEQYADLVTRPLFIQGRRPVIETGSEQNSAALGTDVFDWQLNGVYTYRGSLSALFSRDKNTVAKDRFRKLKVNGDLDGWVLTEIHKDKAILTQQDGESKILLLRKDKPKNLPPTGQEQNAEAPTPADPRRSRGHRTINAPNTAEAESESPPPDPEIIEEAPEIIENE